MSSGKDSKAKKPPPQAGPMEPESSGAPWSAVNSVLDGLATGDPNAPRFDRDRKQRRTTPATKPGAFSSTAADSLSVARSTSPRAPLKKMSAPPAVGVTEPPGEPSLMSMTSFRRTKSRAPDPTVSLGFAPLSTLEEPGATMQPRAPASKPSLKMKRAFAPATQPGVLHVGENANKGRYGKQRRTVAATQPGAFSASEPDDVGRPVAPVKTASVASSTGQGNVKLRRTAAATTPGAAFVASEPGGDGVAAAPVKPTASSSVGQGNVKIKRTAPALVPGVVSEPSSKPTSTSIISASDASPSSPKGNVKMKRTAPAQIPGAVTSSSPEEPGVAAMPASTLSIASTSSSTGNVKLKRSAPALVPGVISEPTMPTSTSSITSTVSSAGQGNVKIKRSSPALVPGVVSEPSEATAEVSRDPSEPSPQEPRPVTRKASSGLVKLRHAAPAVVPGAIAEVEEPQEPGGPSAAPLSREEAEKLLKTRRRSVRAGGLVPGVRDVSGEEAEQSNEVVRRKDPRAAARALSKTKDDKKSPIDPNESEENRQRRLDAKLDEMERLERGRSARLQEEAAAAAAAAATTAAAVTTADRGQVKEPPLQYGETNWEHPGSDGGEHPGDGELVVAQAVEDDDDEYDPFLAFAEEYDPDAKPPLYRNRRFRLYAMLALIAVIAIIVGVIVGVTLSDGDILPPTMAPTTEEELSFRLQFSEVSDKVFVKGTSYDLAAKWIMFEDPMSLTPDAPNLIQRYVLALFYYMTTNNRQRKWLSCNPPEPEEDANCTFLVLQPRFDEYDKDQVYVEEDGWSRWLSSANECDWAGVYCDRDDTVRELEIWGHNITGTLPSELSSLPFLQWISLQDNEFTGTLPWDVFGKMRQLVVIEMHFNRLTGSIPEFFWEETTALQNLNIGGNKMTGTISTQLGRMTELFGLHLFENEFVGSVPSEIGNLRSLAFLRVQSNQFTGEIPTEIGNLSNLEEVFWYNNPTMTATIPSEIGVLTKCSDLFLDRNRLGGSIPEELYNLEFLNRLYLHENELTGTLSTNIARLWNLFDFRLRRNQLTGTIPTELVDLDFLRLMWLDNNLFTGPVPLELCGNVGPGKLEFLQADCSPEGNAPNECECCSTCCNRVSTVCFIQEF